jgi:hypothetical protein
MGIDAAQAVAKIKITPVIVHVGNCEQKRGMEAGGAEWQPKPKAPVVKHRRTGIVKRGWT